MPAICLQSLKNDPLTVLFCVNHHHVEKGSLNSQPHYQFLKRIFVHMHSISTKLNHYSQLVTFTVDIFYAILIVAAT